MHWEQTVVLVTGGTGSFGRKFIRILLDEYHPKKVIVFSRDELKQHDMRRRGFDHPDVRWFIGDVRDEQRVLRAMNGVDVVVHAAALKQVPACEYNPMEAVKTNIDGAENIINAALDAHVSRLIALSTDKAVNPINLYGATKLCAEKIFVQSNAYAGSRPTRFSCVRYGNVVGSRGSVVPLFLDQRPTGVLTVTDPRMTRFWLTLEQGARFVISAIERMIGGEIFVPKIPSMNILDLARAIAPEAEIREIGIRAGEKLHEALLSDHEARHTIDAGDMYVVTPLHPWWTEETWNGGARLPENFQYTSDTNDRWLSVDELREQLQGLELD
ncbi:MAG TPA: UDP-N-acetylglucosamine 4,6-dehydratase (inverting) [bacterium]|nr:UDP-N-acetylglucosamine 4,6-dehydratase (inverting) [bacterium]HQP97090.1 UDP-N-acetylglucosamine 4,6-dehydratase (inverting) [bacterium]